MRIATARLDLVPLTAECLAAAPADRETVARAVGAIVPESWPPEHYDQDSLDFMKREREENPAAWPLRCIVLREPEPVVAGVVGCMTPNDAGEVLIGYSVLPEYQRRGYASEALAAVMEWALRDRRVTAIVGDTYPELVASVRTMESCGLRFAGPGPEERTVRYRFERPLT